MIVIAGRQTSSPLDESCNKGTNFVSYADVSQTLTKYTSYEKTVLDFPAPFLKYLYASFPLRHPPETERKDDPGYDTIKHKQSGPDAFISHMHKKYDLQHDLHHGKKEDQGDQSWWWQKLHTDSDKGDHRHDNH